MHRIEKKTEKSMKENCGKIENILNLALDATWEEREKSLNLDSAAVGRACRIHA